MSRFALLCLAFLSVGVAHAAPVSLEEGFRDPPEAARPRVWWHWMNGNVSKEGVTRDLEAMKRVGIAGVQIFTADLDTPVDMKDPIVYMTPAWLEMIKFSAQECQRLGLEMTIHSAAGWSETGGTWVRPEDAMQRLVWSETKVRGPAVFDAVLTPPPSAYGSSGARAPVRSGGRPAAPGEEKFFYRDIAVLAFASPKGEGSKAGNRAVVPRAAPELNVRSGNFSGAPSTTTETGQAVSPQSVVELTTSMRGDGRLQWKVPPGDWTILRFGHTATGAMNGPAPVEARGLEVDKMDRGAVTAYFTGFVEPLAKVLGPLLGKTLQYVLMDSWEAGTQDWTPHFLREFHRRRGYMALPYLPVMAGHVIGGEAVADRFLEDVRLTIAELIADNHYRTFADLLHQRKMGLYAESIGIGQPTIADGLAVRGIPDIPMGEFWVRLKTMQPEPDSKLAANAGHIYGKNIVAAEAFTTSSDKPSYGVSPFMMKRTGDINLAGGINRMVIHEYAHQPRDDRKPGFTLGPFGAMFNRQITWWEQGAAWLRYLARASFLLQQGVFRADILYFYGESVPSTVPARPDIRPALPDGYDYDYVNAEVLHNRITVGPHGELKLPEGTTYRVLALATRVMSPTLLKRLRTLLQAGATIVGDRPERAPGLTGYPASDREVAALSDELWGSCAADAPCEHVVGAHGGKVVVGKPLKEVLAGMGLAPDIEVAAAPDAHWAWIHRATADTDIYFLSNQKERAEPVTVRLRLAGKIPELWDADSGRIVVANDWGRDKGVTTVKFTMDPSGSNFIIFRKIGSPRKAVARRTAEPKAVAIEGPWDVRFAPAVGTPIHLNLPRLISWTEHADPEIRYMAGSATYAVDFSVASGGPMEIDLGQVNDFAEVSIDGEKLATLWKPPYRVAWQPKKNGLRHHLEVRVTNMWPNRLIGDAQLPPEQRRTWSTYNPYTKDSPLTPAGLLGPVRLLH